MITRICSRVLFPRTIFTQSSQISAHRDLKMNGLIDLSSKWLPRLVSRIAHAIAAIRLDPNIISDDEDREFQTGQLVLTEGS